MDYFFTRSSMGRVLGLLEVNSVLKKWKIYLNFKIPEIFGFLDLGLSLQPDTWLYLFGHGISQTQSMWGHTQNLSSFGSLILHLAGEAQCAPPLSQMWSWDPLNIRVKIISKCRVVADFKMQTHVWNPSCPLRNQLQRWRTGGILMG